LLDRSIKPISSKFTSWLSASRSIDWFIKVAHLAAEALPASAGAAGAAAFFADFLATLGLAAAFLATFLATLGLAAAFLATLALATFGLAAAFLAALGALTLGVFLRALGLEAATLAIVIVEMFNFAK